MANFGQRTPSLSVAEKTRVEEQNLVLGLGRAMRKHGKDGDSDNAAWFVREGDQGGRVLGEEEGKFCVTL